MVSMKKLGKKTLLDYRSFLSFCDLRDYNNNEQLFNQYKNAQDNEKIFIRNQIIEANLPLVVRFLLDKYNYQFDVNPVYDMDDVIQEANILLLESIKKYDDQKGSFSNYLYSILQTHIYYANGIPNAPIYFDHNRTYRYRKIKKYIDLGYSDDEILSRENIPAKTLKQIKPFLLIPISIDYLRKKEVEENQEWVPDFVDYQDLREAEIYLENLLEASEVKDRKEVIEQALNKLNPSDRLLLTLVYGLNGDEPQKISMAGKTMGITYRYTYLKYHNALEKLFKNKDLRNYLGYAETSKVKTKK